MMQQASGNSNSQLREVRRKQDRYWRVNRHWGIGSRGSNREESLRESRDKWEEKESERAKERRENPVCNCLKGWHDREREKLKWSRIRGWRNETITPQATSFPTKWNGLIKWKWLRTWKKTITTRSLKLWKQYLRQYLKKGFSEVSE